MKRKSLASILILMALTLGVNSLYEKEKGKKDWKIENLGEIHDIRFIENSSQVYTLSKSGLLTLFDYEKQTLKWKKELPALK